MDYPAGPECVCCTVTGSDFYDGVLSVTPHQGIKEGAMKGNTTLKSSVIFWLLVFIYVVILLLTGSVIAGALVFIF